MLLEVDDGALAVRVRELGLRLEAARGGESPSHTAAHTTPHAARRMNNSGYRGVPLEKFIENTHFTVFSYQCGIVNDPF